MKRSALEPWRPRRPDWNLAAATHLSARVGFGAPREELDRLLSLSFDAALEEVLGRDAHEPRLLAGGEQLLPTGKIEDLGAWWMALILAGGAPLRERATLMWHDHFATSQAKVQDQRLMHGEIRLFREEGLGDFRELLHRVARDPAMLVWLDGSMNRRGQPNENFAREVLELFALGIGNYDERDVSEAARAFTGWKCENRRFVTRASDHDPGEKLILGERGHFDGDEAVDIILRSPACPRHIARRLLEEFVAPEPHAEWIEETARVLVENDWSIETTIRTIVASELFFSPSARRSRIAGPVELVAMTVRRLGLSCAPAQAFDACRRMGQYLFHPPSVKGWDGMRVWINAGTWIERHNSLVRLVESKGAELSRRFDSESDLVRALLPDLETAAFLRTLGNTGSGSDGLAVAAAAILTSPEYHLI